jgi:hypothetical protein
VIRVVRPKSIAPSTPPNRASLIAENRRKIRGIIRRCAPQKKPQQRRQCLWIIWFQESAAIWRLSGFFLQQKMRDLEKPKPRQRLLSGSTAASNDSRWLPREFDTTVPVEKKPQG